MTRISGVYKIINKITKDFYIGSSADVFRRWRNHKSPSKWKEHPNSPLYRDMQKYGVDKFRFQILAPVMPKHLKQVEQEFIELLSPTYNQMYAKGQNPESPRKSSQKYRSQLCEYNGETLTLNALSSRFLRAGISHPVLEAKKYMICGDMADV